MFLAKQAPFLLFFGGSVKGELYIICEMFKYQSRVNDVVLSYTVDAAGVLSYVDTAGGLSCTVDAAGVLSYVDTAGGLSYTVDAAGVLSYVDTAGGLSYTVDAAGVLSLSLIHI